MHCSMGQFLRHLLEEGAMVLCAPACGLPSSRVSWNRAVVGERSVSVDDAESSDPVEVAVDLSEITWPLCD